MIFIAYSKQLLRFCVGTVTDWVSRNATWNYSRESFSYQMPAFDKVYSSEILRQFITLHLGRAFRASLGKEKNLNTLVLITNALIFFQIIVCPYLQYCCIYVKYFDFTERFQRHRFTGVLITNFHEIILIKHVTL